MVSPRIEPATPAMFERHADALPMSHLGHYKSIVKKMIKKQAATLESFKRSLKQSNQ
jgi:hypothetical protein